MLPTLHLLEGWNADLCCHLVNDYASTESHQLVLPSSEWLCLHWEWSTCAGTETSERVFCFTCIVYTNHRIFLNLILSFKYSRMFLYLPRCSGMFSKLIFIYRVHKCRIIQFVSRFLFCIISRDSAVKYGPLAGIVVLFLDDLPYFLHLGSYFGHFIHKTVLQTLNNWMFFNWKFCCWNMGQHSLFIRIAITASLLVINNSSQLQMMNQNIFNSEATLFASSFTKGIEC